MNNIRTCFIPSIAALLISTAATALAQTSSTPSTTTTKGPGGSTTTTTVSPPVTSTTPTGVTTTKTTTVVTTPSYKWQAGDREFTLGGVGTSNTDFDDSFGSVNFSYGHYMGPNTLLALRQTVAYSNPEVGGVEWNGATRLAFDYHFGREGGTRPFAGVNLGGIYGDGVNDSWAAGLETGVKFYVQPRTFVFAMLEYAWLFDDGGDLDDRFDDGQLNWTVGIGFNF